MTPHLPGTVERTSIFSEVRNSGRSKGVTPNLRVNSGILRPSSNHPPYICSVHPFLGESLISFKRATDCLEEGAFFYPVIPAAAR